MSERYIVDLSGTLKSTFRVGGAFAVLTSRMILGAAGDINGGGALDGDLTLSLAPTAVVAGDYGDAASTVSFTVDAKGRITGASTIALTPAAIGAAAASHTHVVADITNIGAVIVEGDSRLTDSRTPIGAAGGHLSGTYPNPNIASGVIVDSMVNASAAIAWSKISKSGAVAADIGAASASHTHSWSAIVSGTPTTLAGYGIADGVATSRQLNGTKSIVGGGDLSANRTFELENDETSPGNSQLYGTDASGVRGWYPIPTTGLSGLATFGISGDLTLTKSGAVARVATFPNADIIVAGIDLAQTWTAAQTFGTISSSSADINGGTLDGVVIGGDAPAAASVTTLSASGIVTLGTIKASSAGLVIQSFSGATVVTFGTGGNQTVFADGVSCPTLTLSGDLLAGGRVDIASTSPQFSWNETDQAADLKRWSLYASGGTLILRAQNDAQSSEGVIFSVSRSTFTPVTFALTPKLSLVSGENSAPSSDSFVYIYRSGASGSGLFAEAGHLVLQGRTNTANRGVIILAGNGTPMEVARFLSGATTLTGTLTISGDLSANYGVVVARNDLAKGIQLSIGGSTVVSTLFGLTRSSLGELVTDNSAAGLLIGHTGASGNVTIGVKTTRIVDITPAGMAIGASALVGSERLLINAGGAMPTVGAAQVAITNGQLSCGNTGATSIKTAGGIALSGDVTNSKSTTGALLLLHRNTSAAAGAYAHIQAQNDGNTAISVDSFSSGYSGTSWGLTLANYVALYAAGSSNNGLIVGNAASKPVLFGVGAAIVGKFSAAGSFVLGNAALATTATDGFVYVPSCAGTPTGVPTTETGRVPMLVDTTGSKLWAYIGGTWKSATLT